MANSTHLSIHLHLSNPPLRSASKFIINHCSSFLPKTHLRFSLLRSKRTQEFGIRALQDAEDAGSYLHMWKKAVARTEMEKAEQNHVDNGVEESEDDIEKKSEQFKKILDVPVDERDKVQRLQVIDRASAAIAAARAILSERPLSDGFSGSKGSALRRTGSNSRMGSSDGEGLLGGNPSGVISSAVPQSETSKSRAPGPDFWSWSPPIDAKPVSEDALHLKAAKVKYSASYPIAPVMEKEKSIDSISLPFESKALEPFHSKHDPPLPPLQSLVEVNVAESSFEVPSHSEDSVDAVFSTNSAVAASVLGSHEEASTHGENEDGSRWWRETGVEQRADGVVCRWTLLRGISASKDVEWEEKYWEASDQDYKELGSEKSGRDAAGNVWREYWRESMWQDIKTGLLNIEKTADKWGKNGKNEEWQEKWWERYDASGFAEKWAHKWCCIDPFTPLKAGHAHVWHERWGEKYNGRGSSMKYTDKWAERLEGDVWTKWGDKWDESFDDNGHGVKQGETWWQGAHGEHWNRTWGERHNGSGWIHKYGKSSSGEHWDTHVQQETWYEKYPHYGFEHCYENSEQLRQVQKPKRTEL
ncbi:hypothetical protein EJ110_NYTH35476 [Nymphaea thermarum]|nr:hypothetical protein EJ110_NYTH35476 [Nymphaea thermarum]